MIQTVLQNGTPVQIWFSHKKELNSFGRNHNADMVTVCDIKIDDLTFTGKAFKIVEDNFNKSIGRKNALTKALRYATDILSKSDRRTVWEAYFKSCR